MDFFEQQDRARGLSGYLIFLFGLGVFMILVAIFCVASFAVGTTAEYRDLAWTWGLAIISCLLSGSAIFAASAFRINWLSKGGQVIAESLGGQRISGNTKDPSARQILNVVEEMAIASGTPVPPVYLIDEEGINAFAAGYSPRDAVIGVTRGCALRLNRDQLQGVMAHEFSHILNGDMRTNIRLTGIIFGIVFLSRIGRIMLDFGRLSGGRRRSGKNEGGGILLVLAIGLFLIGGIGAFFGAMIRASISRQREFLADASAVQFTRNPEGISGALKRIGGFSEGSKLHSPEASEFSHMFFGSGISSLFATHPPLPIRILRIEPNWKKTYPNTDKIIEKPPSIGPESAVSGFLSSHSSPASTNTPTRPKAVAGVPKYKKTYSARTFLKTNHQIDQEKLTQVRTLISSIPKNLIEQAREPFGSRCLLFAMLLDTKDEKVMEKQLRKIELQCEKGTAEQTEKIKPSLFGLSIEQKFILVEEARPGIAELSPRQFSDFQNLIFSLIASDDQITLFEWSLQKVIDHDFGKKHSTREQLHGRASVSSRLPECAVLIGALAHHGQDGADPKPAYDEGIRALDRSRGVPFPEKNACGLSSMDRALQRLSKLSAVDKRSLLQACAQTIDHDGKTTDVEIQILRGISCSLSCPIGPNLIANPQSA